MDLDLDALTEAPERWIDLGGLAFNIRYNSPTYGDTFRRLCIRDGIGKSIEGRFEVNLGREADYYRMLAQHYVLGWRGVKKGGEEVAYSVEQMTLILSRRGDVLAAISKAINSDETFFGSNGNKPT